MSETPPTTAPERGACAHGVPYSWAPDVSYCKHGCLAPKPLPPGWVVQTDPWAGKLTPAEQATLDAVARYGCE